MFRRTGIASNLTYIYDLDMRQWSLVQTAKTPPATVKHWIISYCNRILLFGGYNYGPYSSPSSNHRKYSFGLGDMWMYDIANKAWNPITACGNLTSFSTLLPESSVLSLKWNTSNLCNDVVVVLTGQNWSSFWRLQILNDQQSANGWVYLRSQSKVSPSCGVIKNLASSISASDIYGIDCNYRLWSLSLRTLKWLNLGLFSGLRQLVSGLSSLAMFFETENEYVYFSKHWSERLCTV